MKQDRYDIANVSNLPLVQEQIKEIAKLDNYDDLVETYKRDVDLLYSDRFSKGLELKKRLFDARDTHEKSENWNFAFTTGTTVLFLTVIVSGVAMFLYDYDKFVVRFPVYLKYWRSKRRCKQLQGESRVKEILALSAEYDEKAESLGLVNGEIELDLLRSVQTVSAAEVEQRQMLDLAAKSLRRIQKHRLVFLEQLQPADAIRTASTVLNSIQQQQWICEAEREEIKDACFSLAIDFHLARTSQPSLLRTIEVCTLYTKHRSKDKTYSKTADLETVLASLRQEIQSIGESSRKRARDSSMVKESVEDYLLRRLS